MAGEWTKFEDGLPSKREVLAIARATKLHPERVACKLMAVWAWARRNSIDGVLHGVTIKDIDTPAGHRGFGAAMNDPGVMWVTDTPDGLVFPNWERHNSNGAKARALDSRRKESGKASANVPDGFRIGTGKRAEEIRTRAEQSRAEQEKTKTKPPEQGSADPPDTPTADPPPVPPEPDLAAAHLPCLPALPGQPVPHEPLLRRGVWPEQARALAAVGVTGAHLDAALADCRGDPRLRKSPMVAAIGIVAKAAGVKLRKPGAGNVAPDLKAANEALLRRRDQIGARA